MKTHLLLAGILCLSLAPLPLAAQSITTTGEVSPTPASSPTWSIPDHLVVGDSPGQTGTLTVSGPGTASLTTASATLGNGIGSHGTVTISGSQSSWTNAYDMNIGYQGTGVLTIENGGSVSSSGNVYIGQQASSSGEVTVTGAGSNFTIHEEFNLGFAAGSRGTLRIEHGAQVSSNAAIVGLSGAGEATVTGIGSRWESTGPSLAVGYAAQGQLVIEKGGILSTEELNLGTVRKSHGTVIVRGDAIDGVGTLEVNALSTGLGGASLIFDGGRVRTLGLVDDLTSGFAAGDIVLNAGGIRIETTSSTGLSAALTGTGGLIKEGNGALELTGHHTFTGVTQVLAGSLAIDGSLASHSVFVEAGAAIGGIGTLAGDLTLRAGAKFHVQANPLSVLGDVFLDPTFGVDDLVGLFVGNNRHGEFLFAADGIYTIFADTTTDFSSLGIQHWGETNAYHLGNGLYGHFEQLDGLQLVFTTSAIPEPSTYAALAGLAALGLVIARKRRQAKRAES